MTPNQGHGTIRLPAEYVREHVRLGYAATEHGNQGVTTDIAHHLVTAATTSRGLYVGATRGRDRNDLHVITDSVDPADARRTRDGVLTLDRADTPALVHRRHLESLEPAAPATRVPELAWLAPWRKELRQQWEPLARARQEREDSARQAVVDLQDLKPAVDAAKTAWAPYHTQLAELDATLTRELEPALRTARCDAEHARLGHRRKANRAVEAAEHAMQEMRERLDVVNQAAQPARECYEALANRAASLREHTRSDHLVAFLEDSQRRPLELLLDAIDYWNDWNHQQPVSPDDLTTSLQRLHAADADHDLRELTQPLSAWLHERGIDLTPAREIDHDLAIDL
ncbi:MAG: hypothetical protein ACKO91_13525 [Acidimicrobiales bacterium]